ncbi:DnaJ domain-containing protein [Xylaria intraflava]|nr:DnaJ domain-containing protein [Xylaria intraflava]
MADPVPDFYAVLGVSPYASDTQIRKAYCQLALKKHPDRNPGNPAATADFQLLQQAYDILSDSETRQKFHLERHITAEQRAVSIANVARERRSRVHQLGILRSLERILVTRRQESVWIQGRITTEIRALYNQGVVLTNEWTTLYE